MQQVRLQCEKRVGRSTQTMCWLQGLSLSDVDNKTRVQLCEGNIVGLFHSTNNCCIAG